MGIFSKFREAGESADMDIVEKYGEPKRSLFTSSKVFSLHEKIDITDANDHVVYQSNTKFPSIHDKTDITNQSGEQVAHIERKLLSMHERHFVKMADGTEFQLSNELFHLIKDITNIEGLGWQLRGNILGLNFELFDANDNIVAAISQKMISIHDKYCVDIYQVNYEPIVVAILITLQKMIKDRENSSSDVDFSSQTE